MTAENQQKGFTLIEVLVAMTLLVIGILAVASMQIISLGGNSQAIRVTEASTWGGDKLETLMARPYSHAELVDTNGNGVAGLSDTDVVGSLADGGPEVKDGFTVFWNVADNTPVTDCKTIRVIVRRSDKGVSKTVSFDYMKANAS